MLLIHRHRIAKGCFLLLFVFFLWNPALTQVRVKKVDNPETVVGKKGVVYGLPRTVLVIDLEYSKTETVPGPYAEFSKELIGIEDIIIQSTTTYFLEDATISALTEMDPQQIYLVEMYVQSSDEVLLEFSGNGLLVGVELSGEQRINARQWVNQPEESEPDLSAIFPHYKPASMKEVVDTIVRKITFDTITYQEKILNRTLVEMTEKEQAEEAAALINEITQDQYSLLVGYQETAYSYEAIKYMYDKLESKRRNYVQLFTGTTMKEQFSARYFIVPTVEMMDQPFPVLIGLKSQVMRSISQSAGRAI